MKQTKIKSNGSEYKYICDYGIRHNLTDECNCFSKFKIPHHKFWERLTSRNYIFSYPSQIRESRINEFLFNHQDKIEMHK